MVMKVTIGRVNKTIYRSTEMKKEFEAQMNASLAMIEESLFGRYSHTNKVVEEKIQEFMALLSRIGKQQGDNTSSPAGAKTPVTW